LVAMRVGEVQSDVLRCPACGQRYQYPFPPRCAICEFDFGFTREAATGTDVSPYARSFAHGKAGWRSMAEWIWFAGAGRLKHLAMMQASAASRRFARVNLLMLAGGLTVLQATRIGWRAVSASPAVESSGAVEPMGRGWLHVASTPSAIRMALSSERPVDLWWNPAQAIIGGVFAGLFALLLMGMVLVIVRAGLTQAHAPLYHKERRMTAALHYSTVWAAPIVIGLLFFVFMPLHWIGAIRHWPWYPSSQMIWIVAGILDGFGFLMWWFWLGRLGMTAPQEPRAGVVAMLVGGTALTAAAAFFAWWYGTNGFCGLVFERFQLAF